MTERTTYVLRWLSTRGVVCTPDWNSQLTVHDPHEPHYRPLFVGPVVPSHQIDAWIAEQGITPIDEDHAYECRDFDRPSAYSRSATVEMDQNDWFALKMRWG